MTGTRERSDWRGLAAVLACLALSLRVLIPAGFMIQPGAASGVPIVLCTTQGTVTLQPEALAHAGDKEAPRPGQKHDGGVCVFAGHGAPGLAPIAAVLPISYLAKFGPGPSLSLGLTPGRGLAAPPPPARGPPLKS
jgi:hypothetical protein